MISTLRIKSSSALTAVIFVMVSLVLFGTPRQSYSADREVASGPFSLSLRGGGLNDSGALGVDARLDYLSTLVNLHVFGTFDMLKAGNGEGQIDNKRYGAGLALSHTLARQANLYVGTSFLREMDETFGHAYVGGKLKVTDYALLSASYGFGFGQAKNILQNTNSFIAAEAVDWLKTGVVLVNGQGLKTNLYYFLTDPGNQRISGLEGEISYPLLDNLTFGVNGSCDLSRKADLERNWRSFLFVTYAFGGQKGNAIDVALDKNNPAEYPKVLRKTVRTSPGSTLSVSPAVSTAAGCGVGTVTLTAKGGVPPYAWTSSEEGTTNLSSGTGTTITWKDTSDNFCGGAGTVTITVTDSASPANSASATINVTGGGV